MRNGRDTTLIDCAPTCLSGYYDDDFCARMADLCARAACSWPGQTVQRIEGEGPRAARGDRPGRHRGRHGGVCHWVPRQHQAGRRPFGPWRHGPYLVDRCQRTSDAAVFAVGDCATVYNNATRGTDYIALATNAVRTGIVAAHNACGTRLEGNGVQGSNGISIWGWNMFSTGLSLKKARALGYDAAATDREDWQKAAFIESGNYKTWLRVVYDKATRRILGAELASSQDVSMGLHMFSLAIEQGYTIDQLKLLDIFFCRISTRRTTTSPWPLWAHSNAQRPAQKANRKAPFSQRKRGLFLHGCAARYALPTEPNSSIFSRTVAFNGLYAGASSCAGQSPCPAYLCPLPHICVAAAKASWHSVFTLILETPRLMAFLIMSAGMPVPPCSTRGM